MNTWVKPNGIELELNDEPATIEAAKANKWKLKDDAPKEYKDMSADELKAIIDPIDGVEYTTKPAAIEYLTSQE
jgi:hypothetical protein